MVAVSFRLSEVVFKLMIYQFNSYIAVRQFLLCRANKFANVTRHTRSSKPPRRSRAGPGALYPIHARQTGRTIFTGPCSEDVAAYGRDALRTRSVGRRVRAMLR